jgi:hypothetical protein
MELSLIRNSAPRLGRCSKKLGRFIRSRDKACDLRPISSDAGQTRSDVAIHVAKKTKRLRCPGCKSQRPGSEDILRICPDSFATSALQTWLAKTEKRGQPGSMNHWNET